MLAITACADCPCFFTSPFPCDPAGQSVVANWKTNGTINSATPVQAVYYGPGGDAIRHNLDVDGDGVGDYILCSDTSGANIIPLGSNSLLVTRSYDDFGPNTGVVLLNAGFIIGPDSTSSNGFQWFDRQLDIYGYAVLGSNLRGLEQPASISSGSPTSDIDAYIGVRFDSAGKTRYGWIHIFKYATVAAGQLFGWAYETRANSPIKAGQVVVTIGDRIEELCPCDGPWRNHGEYVTRMIVVLAQFQRQRLITPTEARAILKEAVQSDCGKRPKPHPHPPIVDGPRCLVPLPVKRAVP
ncbi:MAG: hypothetical protein MUF81_07110 [Verrucomicrobia bacterium]|nr:hypothetical protein [Verrucomicrobiota bacterium]